MDKVEIEQLRINVTESRSKLTRWGRGALLCLVSVSFVIVGAWVSDAKRVWHDLSQFPAWTVASVLIAFALNLAAVSYRLGRLLSFFGIHLPASIVSRASVRGHFAALFLISLFGQVAGRQWVLRHYGTPSVFISTLTAIERVILFVISGAICLLGASWLIGVEKINEYFGRISFVQLVMVGTASLLLSYLLGRSRFEKLLYSRARSKAAMSNMIEIAAVTLLAQTLVLLAFVIAVKGMVPGVEVTGLLAAAAITSFAAGLPISVNGWGIREVVSIYAFGLVGVPSASAMAASILVGMCSSAVVLAAFPFASGKSEDQLMPRSEMLVDKRREKYGIPVERIGAWTLTTATAILIFFQLHLPLSSGEINLNLADPFAVFALAAVASHCLGSRVLPVWRVQYFNMALLTISLLLLSAFIHGVQYIGVTQWAFAGRLLGWLVLLGYLSLGPLTVSYLGFNGLLRFFETLTVTASVIVIAQVILRWLSYSGWINPGGMALNFEGYAGNRNAFAFQMLICSVLLLSFSNHYRKLARRFRPEVENIPKASRLLVVGKERVLTICHGITLAGIVFSASRAGMLVGLILIVAFSLINSGNRRFLGYSMVFAFVIWILGAYVLPEIAFLVNEQINPMWSPLNSFSPQSRFSNDISNLERWETIRRGFEMWLASPLFGAGLGVFIESSSAWFKQPIVIHSTLVWILAEFGLLGATIFLVFFIGIAISVVRNGLSRPQNVAVAMLLLAFSTFGLVHEIFYQRIFWLILGILLALPFKETVSLDRMK